ncbi:hypothetical protein [Paenibacillus sp. MBLB4367]|uniref:hypothetical protein n=1 Tax=Paenibacillus sp. MBLB4367 TaxID=3384767 RepID=UPI003908416B
MSDNKPKSKKTMQGSLKKAMLLTLMVPLFAGCVATNVSEVELLVEAGVVQAHEQLWIRYADGTVEAANVRNGLKEVDDFGAKRAYDSYKAHTDPKKVIVGMYVTDGNVSWVPAFHFIRNGYFRDLAASSTEWGKPTVPAASAKLLSIRKDPIAGVYSAMFEILGADGKPVDGFTEAFAQSSNAKVKLIDPATGSLELKVKGMSAAAHAGIVEFKLVSAGGDGELTESDVLDAISLASGSRVLSLETQTGAGGKQPEDASDHPGRLKLTVGQPPIRLSASDVMKSVYAHLPDAASRGIYGNASFSVVEAVYQTQGIVGLQVKDGELNVTPVAEGSTSVTAVVYDLKSSARLPIVMPVQVFGASTASVSLSGMLHIPDRAGEIAYGATGDKALLPNVRYRLEGGRLFAWLDDAELEAALAGREPVRQSLVLALPPESEGEVHFTLSAEQADRLRAEMANKLAGVEIRYKKLHANITGGLLLRAPAGVGIDVTLEPGAGRGEQKVVLSPLSNPLDTRYHGRDGLRMEREGVSLSVTLSNKQQR